MRVYAIIIWTNGTATTIRPCLGSTAAAGSEVSFAYGMIPSPISKKTSEEWCREYGIEHCASIEELIEKSDALVVLSPDNCEMHEELSKLALQSGKKTYIDKIFAALQGGGQRPSSLWRRDTALRATPPPPCALQRSTDPLREKKCLRPLSGVPIILKPTASISWSR